MFAFRPSAWGPGLLIIAVGEALRLLAVGHIGLPSRTRAEGVGTLVRSGPYAWVRNPLYLGNILLFTGLGTVLWPSALLAAPLLAVHYQLIVRWEESNIAARLGDPYRRYLDEVPRWLPRAPARGGVGPGPARFVGTWSASKALRSERSTLIAIGGVLLLLCMRAAVA